MKIALCFFGLPRLINECHDDIKKYFIENINVDIYAHFWWSPDYCGKINRLHVKEKYPIDYQPIELFKNIYKPKKIIYEECPISDQNHIFKINGWTTCNAEDENEFYLKIITNYIKYTFYSRYLSQYKCYKLIENVNDYDLIIFLRTDLIRFDNLRTFIQDFQNCNIENNVYCASSLHGGPMFGGEYPDRACDWFEIISPIYVDKYMNTKYEIIHDKNSRIPIHNQEKINYFANKSNLNLKIFNSAITVRRYIVEEWENKKYLLENKIEPQNYNEIFLNCKDNINNEILPFYTKYILNWKL